MIVLDDILMAPVRSIAWIFRSVHKAVQDEQSNEESDLRARLSDLYRELERGEITEEQFDAQESKLLDRLDALKAQEEAGAGGRKR
ncbi:gas vesicle protein GvpG [Comamonas sp. JC664]|uniref:gas vesicle protein GvpG n=1 Tax=Comamonas sp. JC664 TaxID=2801917 RepID=UPI00174C0370|nr:gas vesicle protein GvpG [Comamonas sp. JC664]MBL0694841.1 gas vesicle protein GvpG [Comamonas sp. JC664]GHG94850.1 gas vesicle protein [Comamonas sp. KCTC 72670]